MAEITKKSVMAIVEEVTEGTPVLPTAGSQYVALQEGFSVSPEFENLENAELSGTVGIRAPIIGSEAPTADVSHYLRHSGVEATAPQFSPMIKAAIGAQVAAAVEHVTVGGSTAGTSSVAAVINGDAGTGATFERGKCALIKDGVNGYSIRPVDSINTDALTLGFNLANAPASGVSLGRAILFKPSDTPPTLSMHVYQGNGGAYELLAGARVTEMSIEANARELINSSFSFEGISYKFDAIEITSSTRYIDFNDGSDKSFALEVKVYSHPHELAKAAQDGMNTVSSGITVTYNDSGANAGKFTFAKASGTFNLEWATGANTANTAAGKFGFAVADETGFLTYTSDNVASWASPQTATFDAGEPLICKDNEFMLGDFDDYGCSGAQSVNISVANEIVKVPDICEESGVGASILSSREVTAEVVLTLARHDADKFRRFKEGVTTKALFVAGSKTGGNWVPGKCLAVYMPQAKISSFAVGEADGVVTMNITLTAFVSASGEGEVYLNFL